MAGDSITTISIRLTGDPYGWQGSGFQILDSAAARFVPKTEFRFLRPEWQACIVEPAVVRPVIGAFEMLEIGRASCRERGEMSGVDVVLQKQRNRTGDNEGSVT